VDEKLDAGKVRTIVFAAIALVVAAFVIYWTIKSQQVEVVSTVNGGTGTNPKVQYMKAQKENKDTAGSERDPNSLGDKQ
jgi:hypothetical protein